MESKPEHLKPLSSGLYCCIRGLVPGSYSYNYSFRRLVIASCGSTKCLTRFAQTQGRRRSRPPLCAMRPHGLSAQLKSTCKRAVSRLSARPAPRYATPYAPKLRTSLLITKLGTIRRSASGLRPGAMHPSRTQRTQHDTAASAWRRAAEGSTAGVTVVLRLRTREHLPAEAS